MGARGIVCLSFRAGVLLAVALAAQGPEIQRARALLDARRFEEGEVAFRAILDARPGDLQARLGLANALLLQGRRVEALAEYETIARADPTHYGARLKAGELRWKLGYLDDAVRELRATVELRPSEPQGWRALGGALLDASGVMLGANQYRRDHLEESVRALQKALAGSPSDAGARVFLGTALRRLGREEDAILAYAEASRLDPRDARAPLALGEIHEARGDLEKALREFERAAEIASSDPRPHRGVGSVHLQRGDAAAAASSYRRALEIDPRMGEARYGLALALFRSGRPEEGRREMEQFRLSGGGQKLEDLQGRLRANPEDREARLALASRYLDRGDADAAVAHLRFLSATGSEDARVGTLLGFALLRLGDADEAEATFRGVVRAQPAVGLGWYGLGLALSPRGALAEAREAFARAAEVLPEDPRPSLELGRTELRLGDARAAEKALREAARLDETGREALLLLVDLFREEGKNDEEARAREELAARETRRP
jgi:tetratricopeptide (TPR) repeat protein